MNLDLEAIVVIAIAIFLVAILKEPRR